MITLNTLKENIEVQTLLRLSERQLEVLGYTEHSFRHVGIVAKRVKEILTEVGLSQREIELGEIAAYLHDIGNGINRIDHPQSGALLAYSLLLRLGMGCEEAGEIMVAIGNHDESCGKAVSKISAALIIADKSDVHRGRVRKNKLLANRSLASLDIHDRVNFAVEDNTLEVNLEKKEILFNLTVDTNICSAMDFFEIFLSRMRMCMSAARMLGMKFKMKINGTSLL